MVHGYIIILKKNGSDGPHFPVKQSVKIGRGAHCDVRIIVQSVSEQHCLVLVEDGRRALIQNLSSTSQTLVNDVSIGKERHALQHRDIVSVGERSFRWEYAEPNPYYEGKKTYQKRRKSEADSALGSQNVAVVNPLFHKRRTLGPNITYSESSSRSQKVAVLKENNTEKDRSLPASPKTPIKRASLVTRTPQKSPGVRTSRTPKSETPKAKTPKVETPKAKTPKVETPKAKTPKVETPKAKTPKAETPKAKTPKAETPKAETPKSKTPKAETPKSKTPKAETPKAKTPKADTPKAKTPKADTPKAKTPKADTPKAKTPKAETPKAKTPKARTSVAKSSVKTQPKRKSVTSKGVKRRLSTPSNGSSKRLKIESPKSIDKKKMTALMGIHGKSPRLTPSSTPIVRLVLSSKKTPIVRTSKTPRASTIKRNGVKSSIKKPHKPTFAEILKKKAVQRANAVAKKLIPLQAKVVSKKVEKVALSLELPKAFKFGSTGHANSPETIFIGRKVAKTPVVTKRGRKVPLIQQTLKGDIKSSDVNVSGISEMFQTPIKHFSKESKSPSTSSAQIESALSPVPSLNTYKSPRNSVRTPRGGQLLVPETTIAEARTPLKTPSVNTGNISGRSSTRSKQRISLLTSTPAVFGRSQSFAESAFDSPSSLLTGQISAPQSPASGRKSRLDMVAPRSSYVHSPHASPVKSSLKNSPSKSPPSAGKSKNLSVSFNDSIHVKMLVPGSKKSLDTTAPLSSPNSPQEFENNSGVVTPDATTFDFNSIKTPNVPRDMFVSSILSSGGSCSSPSGSAKRKGRAPKSPLNDLSDVRGVRRLMKTPSSPAGYIDVKGVKRLMTKCPTPSYLAVEGVKKLFNDAAAAVGNDPANFAGVRELFASPTSSKPKRFSLQSSPSKSQDVTPVAKIQAEVESKGRVSADSAQTKKISLSLERLSPELYESPIVQATSEKKSILSGKGRVTRNKVKEASPKSKPKRASSREEVAETRRSTQTEATKEVKPTKKTRKTVRASSPLINEPTSSVLESPPKRRTRRAAKVSTPQDVSPRQTVPKTRIRRGAKTASPIASKSSRNSSQPEVNLTPVVAEEGTTSVVPLEILPAKTVPKKTAARKAAAELPLVVSPPKKRATRRTKAAESSPAEKPGKRRLSATENISESPVKKVKVNVEKAPAAEKSPPKRSTRRGKKDATPAAETPEPLKATSSKRKRKVVSFEEEVVTPSKKVMKELPQKAVSPVQEISKKGKSQVEGKSSKSARTTKKTPAVIVSPRKTRSRK